MDRKVQVLHTDVMHIDGHKFLITVCEPLCLTLQVYIERESQSMLGMALQGQLELLRSRGFVYMLTRRVLSKVLQLNLKA
jgi:hypothetical protein